MRFEVDGNAEPLEQTHDVRLGVEEIHALVRRVAEPIESCTGHDADDMLALVRKSFVRRRGSCGDTNPTDPTGPPGMPIELPPGGFPWELSAKFAAPVQITLPGHDPVMGDELFAFPRTVTPIEVSTFDRTDFVAADMSTFSILDESASIVGAIAAGIPTIGTWGALLFGALLVGGALFMMARRV